MSAGRTDEPPTRLSQWPGSIRYCPVTALTPAVLRPPVPASLPLSHHPLSDCKPLGMLRALNFYEILGSVTVRQTEGLVTNASPLADAKAS